MRYDDLKIRLDPWQADFGGELLTEAPPDEPQQAVRLDVEASEPWVPRQPAEDGVLPERWIFIDGVRRIDARLLGRRDVPLSAEAPGLDPVAHGLAASFAVGAVELSSEGARWLAERVHRLVLLPGTQAFDGPLRCGTDLEFEVLPLGAQETTPGLELQRRMQHEESRLVHELAKPTAAGTVVVADGPLRGGSQSGEPSSQGPSAGAVAMGYIKRSAKLYLPASHLDVLARLPAGGRTPLFGLSGGDGRAPRLSWYLRLAEPQPGESELAGLARLEVFEPLGVEGPTRAQMLQAITALADASCRVLPPLGSRPFEDPRAPQNLVPIAALERRLKHALGDRHLVRRRLASVFARREHSVAEAAA